jgi:hypothetical protein
MTRFAGRTKWASLLAVLPVLAGAGQAPAPDSTPITRTATIEAIDKATRTVTLKGAAGNLVPVKAPDAMEGFNSLKVGDVVTATYFAAVAVSLRKPGDPAIPEVPPTTVTQRTDRKPGSVTRRDRTFTGKVDSVDAKTSSLVVRQQDGQVVPLTVSDPAQLRNLRTGDAVEVRYYESLLIKVERPRQ